MMMRTYLFKMLVGMAILAVPAAMHAQVEINETNFPDGAFRSLLKSLPEGTDGMLTGEEIAGLKRLYVLDTDHAIRSLQGIEYLTELGAL